MSLPRVLYIGEHQIGSRISTGVTLADLYQGYPQELVTQFSNPAPGLPSVGHVIEIPKTVAPVAAPVAAAARFYLNLRSKTLPPVVIPHNAIRVESPTIKTRAIADLSAATDISRVRINSGVLKSLRSRRPEVIHAIIGRVRTLRIVLEVSERLDLPIVPHITDDWISTIFTNGEIGGFARRRTLGLIDKLLDRSPAMLVIGDAMAREYEYRYQKKCFVASAGIDPSAFRTPYTLGNSPKRLVYVGSPLIGRAEIADQIGAYAKTRGWEVIVYPMLAERWRQTTSNVAIESQLAASEVPQVLQCADGLLFPESSNPDIAEYTRLSFSTKAAQVIASGRPILAVGPSGQGSIEEIRSNAPRAVVIDSTGLVQLQRAFDYLDANLEVSATVTPEKYWSTTMRASMQKALKLASDSSVNR